MLGAVLGDIIGSVYEWNNIKTTKFPLFKNGCEPTDDSVMTIAVADGLMRAWGKGEEEIKKSIVSSMQYYGRKYPYAGYGGRFNAWLASDDPQPYNSWGNGSGMRVSSVGWLFDDLAEVEHMAALTAEVTHNHTEGIKGAQAIATCVFLARTQSGKENIKTHVESAYGYDISTPLDVIRPTYRFDVSCQGSVPQAIRAFLEGSSYEECVRLAVSIGGDTDTIACMTGAIAEAYYGIPEEIKTEGLTYIDSFLQEKIGEFRTFSNALTNAFSKHPTTSTPASV